MGSATSLQQIRLLFESLNLDCSTAPEAFELTLEDATDANEEPEDASLEAVLGRGRRVKKPTKRFTDAEWCGH